MTQVGVLNRGRANLAAQPRFLLFARLQLLVLILNSNELPVLLVLSIVLTAAVFLREPVLRSPWLWFAVAAALAIGQGSVWWRIDDHIVLSTYLALATGLSRLADDPRRTLAETCRLLIGLVFAFAFGWKILSSQFVSTDFFRFELVTDERFAPVAEWVGGMDSDELAVTEASISEIVTFGETGDLVVLDEGPRNEFLAGLMTVWGIVIEGAIAATFLLPLRGRWRHLRLISLFAFAFTTYVVVPISGFGCLLMTMGLATTSDRRWREPLVAGFAALAVWGTLFPLLVL